MELKEKPENIKIVEKLDELKLEEKKA